MESYIRSTTFEIPFDAVLSEPGVRWFRDAVPTNPQAGPRILAHTHGKDDILAAVHRDKPSIGLVCPMPTTHSASKDAMRSAPATASTPATDANDGDACSDVYVHFIPGSRYRTFGVFEDDQDEACLVVSIHKSVFSSMQKPGKAAAAADTSRSVSKQQLSVLDKAHSSADWIRFLFYATDMVIAETVEVMETGQWCLLDEGNGHFLESSFSPNLRHVQVSLTRSVHTAMDVPYSALMRREAEVADEIEDADFEWLHSFMQEEPLAKDSQQARLLFGPARHPLLAAVHHDRPTIAISWPSERSNGDAIETAAGEQVVDIFTFSPDLYESGGVWLDEELQTCLPVHVTFREAEQVDAEGWAREDADKDVETGDVLLYPQNRVDTAAAIKEWGEWALVDSGRGIGLMRCPRAYPQCEDAPVFLRPLPWGGQRCWGK